MIARLLLVLSLILAAPGVASAEIIHTVPQTCFNAIHQGDTQPWPIPSGYILRATAVASAPVPKVIHLVPALAGAPFIVGTVGPTATTFSLIWRTSGNDFVEGAFYKLDGSPDISINNNCRVDITYSPTLTWMTLETKAKVRRLGELLSLSGYLTGTYGLYCLSLGPGAPLCGSWLVTATILQGAAGGALWTIAAIDPEDWNYAEVVAVVPEPYTPIGWDCPRPRKPGCVLTYEEAAAQNAYWNTLAVIIGLGRAIATTTDRATTALGAGDFAAFALQDGAMRGFLNQLGERLEAAGVLQEALGRLLLQNRKEATDVMAAEYLDPEALQLFADLGREVRP